LAHFSVYRPVWEHWDNAALALKGDIENKVFIVDAYR
jgi:hypothetical protein